MENTQEYQQIDIRAAAHSAIDRCQIAASELSDNNVMDVAHNALERLRKARGKINKGTIPVAFVMAGALAELNARRKTIFEPVGDIPIEEIYGPIFRELDSIPDFVANAMANGESIEIEMLDHLGDLITRICMLTSVHSERFKEILHNMSKESSRKQAEKEKMDLRKKQKENQMTPGRFWLLVALAVIGFIIVVSNF